MVFIANQNKKWKLHNYIVGNVKMSILEDRYYYMEKLNKMNPIKISLMDRDTKKWTKWNPFPSLLVGNNEVGNFGLNPDRKSVV